MRWFVAAVAADGPAAGRLQEGDELFEFNGAPPFAIIGTQLHRRPLVAGDAATFRQAFEQEYTRLFARHIPNAVIEIMSWVVLATTETERPRRLDKASARPAPAAAAERNVFDARLGKRLAVPVYERGRLAPGMGVAGPALVVEEGTSTYVSPSFDLTVDAGGALVLMVKAAM